MSKKKKDLEKKPRIMVKPKLPVVSKPQVAKKSPTREHLLCEEAMELVKDRIHLRLRIAADGFTLINGQPQPWGYTMKGGYTIPKLEELVKRIKDTPTRG